MTGCVHETWHHPAPGTPLICEDCGVLWPGEPLPKAPAHGRAGYDGVANGPGFAARLRTALAQVPDSTP